MTSEEAAMLRSLLTERHVLSLGVLVENQPYVGLLPFAVREDFSALLIHASGLARHSKGLADGAPYSALIHELEAPGADPLQLPRISIEGAVSILQPESPEYTRGRMLYIQKFPQSEMTFSLGDFRLIELELKSGRLVSGFARTSNLNADHFRSLAAL